MSFFRATALLVALPLLTSLSAVALAKAPIDASDAPLDEYFGTQKMSALGIRMRIGDLGRRLHAHTLSDGDALHDALILEDSYHAWDKRYPLDGWLAPTAFHLEQLYTEVQLPDGRTHATAMLRYIAQRFGTTKYGHESRLRLAQGFPPLRAPAAVIATTAPGAPAPSAGPSGVATPDASSSGDAAPASTISPAASAPASKPPRAR